MGEGRGQAGKDLLLAGPLMEYPLLLNPKSATTDQLTPQKKGHNDAFLGRVLQWR